MKGIRVVDLFAGCGGLALGFENAGFHVIAGVDNWEPALNVYRKNFPKHEVVQVDLSDVQKSIKEIGRLKPDMIIGGPPCQDFSSAGLRNEDGGRGDLTVSYAKIIARLRPRYFLMENVQRITKTSKLVDAKKIFKKAGYGLTEMVLDASLCGAPQKRKRFVLFGDLGGEDKALLPYLLSKLSVQSMTVREYFKKNRIVFETDNYYRHPRNYSRRAVYSIDEPSPTVRGVNRPVPSGYRGHARDAVAISEVVRPLTTKERSYIQTFPKNFVFEGSKTDVEQLIGNAVPVKLAEYVANRIKEYLKAGNNG